MTQTEQATRLPNPIELAVIETKALTSHGRSRVKCQAVRHRVPNADTLTGRTYDLLFVIIG